MKKETNKKLWAIHNWVGLYVGIVIAVLSITGAAAVFIPEIDRMVNADLLDVKPHGQRQPLTAISDRLRKDFPDHQFGSIELPKDEKKAYLFNFVTLNEDGEKIRGEIAVNPYSGKVLGDRNTQQSLANFMRQIHVRLYDGIYGRQIVGLAGIGLLLSTITGLLIYGNFMKRQLFANIRRGKNIRIVIADWHKLVGISSLLFNLVIAITGAWLGLQPVLMDWFNIKNPNSYKEVEKPISEKEDSFYYVDYDAALEKASILLPDLIPNSIRSSDNGARSINISGNIAGAVYERNSARLILDKKDFGLLYKYDPREADLDDKIYYVQEALHFGDFAGLGLKIIYLLFGLTTAALSITGFIIYLKRNEKRDEDRMKKTVLKYTFGIVTALFLVCMISLYISYDLASTLVSICLYLGLAWLVIKFVYRRWIRT